MITAPIKTYEDPLILEGLNFINKFHKIIGSDNQRFSIKTILWDYPRIIILSAIVKLATVLVPSPKPIILNSNNYISIRNRHNKLLEIISLLDTIITGISNNQHSIWLRWLCNDLKKFRILMQQQVNSSFDALAALDKSNPSGNLFKPIPEQELWEGRIAVYKYRF